MIYDKNAVIFFISGSQTEFFHIANGLESQALIASNSFGPAFGKYLLKLSSIFTSSLLSQLELSCFLFFSSSHTSPFSLPPFLINLFLNDTNTLSNYLEQRFVKEKQIYLHIKKSCRISHIILLSRSHSLHLCHVLTATSTSRSRRSAAGPTPTARGTKSPRGSARSAGGTDVLKRIIRSIMKGNQKGSFSFLLLLFCHLSFFRFTFCLF